MFHVTVDDILFREAIKEFKSITGRAMQDIVNEQAKLLAQRLMRLTYPNSKSQGNKRIQIDVGRVYLSNAWFEEKFNFKNSTLGERIKKLVKAKNVGDLTEIFKNSTRLSKIHIEPFDASRHARARGKDGRVKYPNPNSFPLADQSKVKALVKQKAKNVGLAKAGWGHCYAELGGSVAAWLNRSEAGDIERGGNGEQVFITLVNKVPYMAALDARGNVVGRALQGRAGDMVKAAQRAIARAASEAGLT